MSSWIKKNRDELIVGLILMIIEVCSDLYFQGQGSSATMDPTRIVEVIPTVESRPVPTASPLTISEPDLWDTYVGRDFDVYVLSEEFRWERGTTNVLDPEGLSLSLDQELGQLVRQYGGNYGDLIAVGTASCEGEELEESRRAQDRADRIAISTRKALVDAGETRDRKLHTLNLGKYAKDCGDSSLLRTNPRLTDEQRRVILIAWKKREQPEDLERALRELMANDRPFGIHPEDYTVFVLDRWRKPL